MMGQYGLDVPVAVLQKTTTDEPGGQKRADGNTQGR
jgi:hypothetical protein